jgi:hypothetical protein
MFADEALLRIAGILADVAASLFRILAFVAAKCRF